MQSSATGFNRQANNLQMKLEPRLSALGRMLPSQLGEFFLQQAHGLHVRSLLADLFVTYSHDQPGVDPVATKRVLALLYHTLCRYFRMKVIGSANIPDTRALLIGCHSGVLPWDAACLVTAVYQHTKRFSRNAGDFMFERFGCIERFLAARGTVIGRIDTLERLLEDDELVVLFPGGAKDMQRPIWKRYQVQAHRGFAHGRGGYIKAALRTQSPIAPVAIVGAEEVHIMLTDLPSIARVLGLPYAPVVLSPLPLPARIYIRFGEPIHLAAPPEAARNQAVVDELNSKVRLTLQELIDDTVQRRRGIYWSSYDGA